MIVLSKNYIADNLAHFQAILAHTRGIMERQARVFPVILEQVDEEHLPGGLDILTMLDVTDQYLGKMNLDRLPDLLRGPLPLG